MGSHQRLQPGMVIRGQRDRACKRHGHSHCPYNERRCHLTGTSPSCYPLLSSQSTGTGFRKWTSRIRFCSWERRAVVISASLSARAVCETGDRHIEGGLISLLDHRERTGELTV